MNTRVDFLPAHRYLMYALCSLFFIAVTWSLVASVDIVVTANGKLYPTGRVRVSQPVEGGRITDVHVQDGQRVAIGDPLLTLDAQAVKTQLTASAERVEQLRLQLQRIQAELTESPFVPQSTSSAAAADALAEFTMRRSALAASLAEAQAAESRASAERATAAARRAQAEQILPLVARQAEQQNGLKAQGFVSEAAAMDKQKELVAARQDLASQQEAYAAATAALAQARATRERILGDYRRQLAEEKTRASAELTQAEAEASNMGHRHDQLTLRSTVDGTVNELSGMSAGQVVQAGQTLLTIVPSSDKLRFEGWLRNEDAAFVAPSMPVKVKLSAFPFQKYGWVEGEIAWMGVDSETPESMRNAQGEPLFYRVRVDLLSQDLQVDDKSYPLKAGMQAIADVQVGKRTLMEYLTSPMRKTLLEAAREK